MNLRKEIEKICQNELPDGGYGKIPEKVAILFHSWALRCVGEALQEGWFEMIKLEPNRERTKKIGLPRIDIFLDFLNKKIEEAGK